MAGRGANIRLAGEKIYPIDSVTITGNVLSDTAVNIDIDHADDVTINGNNFFAPKPTNIRGTNSRRIVVSGNTFNPRQFTRPGTILFRNCQDCLITKVPVLPVNRGIPGRSTQIAWIGGFGLGVLLLRMYLL